MDTATEEKRASAALRLKKAQQTAKERAEAMNEYSTEADMRRTKSAKLKALRLAQEAEDLIVSNAEAAKKAAAKKPAAKKTLIKKAAVKKPVAKKAAAKKPAAKKPAVKKAAKTDEE